MLKNCWSRSRCFGRWNWSPPKAATHGFIPPVPIAIKVRPTTVKILTRKMYINLHLHFIFCRESGLHWGCVAHGNRCHKHQDVAEKVNDGEVQNGPMHHKTKKLNILEVELDSRILVTDSDPGCCQHKSPRLPAPHSRT